MIKANLSDIIDPIGALRDVGDVGESSFRGVSIDSRTATQGNLFIAIEGKNDDGHRHISQALARGAAAVVVNNRYNGQKAHPNAGFLVVEDTLKAMHKLASWWLELTDPIRVAITGTNGKTTTKEMIGAVLAEKYRTYKSPGNLNNLYGVPLAIFMMGESTEIAVFEFGMSTPGEIGELTRLVQPQYGVITNVEAAHLETMLTIDAIAEAKFELLDNMPGDGTAILNLDNVYLRTRFDNEKLAKLGFGVEGECDIFPSRFEINGSGCAQFHLAATGEVHLAAPGMHNMYNALAAAAVGQALSVPGDRIRAALESFRAIEMRTETISVNNVLIINDTYNANPASMKFGLDTLAAIKAEGRKFAVLGDMLELGEMSTELHLEIGAYAAAVKPDYLFACGDLAKTIIEGASKHGYPSERLLLLSDVNEMIDHLLGQLRPGDAVLIKASRSMEFDRIVIGLRSQLGRSN